MMNFMNFIYDIANSDFLYYVLIILLIAISLAMLYLVYSQNREISKQLVQKNRDVKRNELEKDSKEIEGSPFTELESLDGREELLEVSKMTIPKQLEYTQSLFSNSELEELQSITRELESGYKDKKTIIDDYEEEQEETAIISYDELLSKKQTISKIEEETVEKSNTYTHEEAFLDRLKHLNENLK